MNLRRISWTLVVLLFLLLPFISLASTTDGTIQNQYAWGENVGWVNFLPTDGNIHITDSAITGYAWDKEYGWINLAPAQSGIKNDGAGNLSGYAWSAGGGYINFSGVTINSSGKFTGTASGVTYGRMTFDCAQCNVTTDWRPRSVRPQCNNAIDDDNDGKIDYPADLGCSSLEDNSEVDIPNAIIPFFSSPTPTPSPSPASGQTNLTALVEKTQDIATSSPEKLVEPKDNTTETLKPIIEPVVKSPLPPSPTGGVSGGINDSEAERTAQEKTPAEEVKKAAPEQAPKTIAGEQPLISEGLVQNFVLTPLAKGLNLFLNWKIVFLVMLAALVAFGFYRYRKSKKN